MVAQGEGEILKTPRRPNSFDRKAGLSQMQVCRCALVSNVEPDFRLYVIDRVVLDDGHADLE